MEQEIWKDVVGYEGLYEVSNLGKVRSVEHLVRCVRHGKEAQRTIYRVFINGRIRKGYHRIALTKDHLRTEFPVHRLVARAFLGPRPEGHQVNHKDGVKGNNLPSNLEYVTAQQNIDHAKSLGLMPLGEEMGQCKLTNEEVLEIRKRYATGKIYQSTLAGIYGVTQGLITKIVNRKNWKHI
jgi:hypothetical protein